MNYFISLPDNLKNMLKPKVLNIGDELLCVAPASYFATDDWNVHNGRTNYIDFKLQWPDKTDYQRYKYLANTDIFRAAEINQAFGLQKQVGILCMRGGYGSARMIDLIDFELIQKNPKILLGYSDITFLQHALYKKTGLITFHAPMLSADYSAYSQKIINEMLTGRLAKNRIYQSENPDYQLSVLSSGQAEGKLLGGNLSMLTSLLGTEYDNDWAGKIIFIEEVGEKPFRIDRMLNQLRQAGKFKNVRGILLGTFSNCQPLDFGLLPEESFSLYEIFRHYFSVLEIPVLAGFSFGHTEDNAIIPQGVAARLDTNTNYVELLESPFV